MYLNCGNTCHSLVCSVFEAPTLEGVPHSVRVSRNQGRVWDVLLLPAGIPHRPGVWTCIEWYKEQTVRTSSWWWDQTPPVSSAHHWRHDLSAQNWQCPGQPGQAPWLGKWKCQEEAWGQLTLWCPSLMTVEIRTSPECPPCCAMSSTERTANYYFVKILLFLNFFHAFWPCFSPSPFLLDSPNPLPTQLYAHFFKKKMHKNENQNKNPTRQTKQKCPQANTMECVLCWRGSSLELIYSIALCWRIRISPFPAGVNCK